VKNDLTQTHRDRDDLPAIPDAHAIAEAILTRRPPPPGLTPQQAVAAILDGEIAENDLMAEELARRT
jgi:hypothetical protein